METNNKACTNSNGAGVVIFLASLILVAMTVKAEEIPAPKIEETKLIWTSDCPEGSRISNSNMCKKKIYVDDSIDVSQLKWEEVEDIAKLAYDWKARIKEKFSKK